MMVGLRRLNLGGESAAAAVARQGAAGRRLAAPASSVLILRQLIMLMIRALIRITRAPGDETLGLAVVVIFSVGGDWFVAGLADLAIRQRVPAARWGDIVTDEN